MELSMMMPVQPPRLVACVQEMTNKESGPWEFRTRFRGNRPGVGPVQSA
jgi:hypothetical protein